MPTYEYSCEACGLQFEKFQQMNDEPLTKCPECGGSVKRHIGKGTGIIFKGSGFHSTDYGNRKPGKTCCGRSERCDTPPCGESGSCKR